MPVTRETVDAIARLARLAFDEAEAATFTAQFNRILDYIDKLAEVDVEGVAPMTHVLEATNVAREDVVLPCLPAEEALRNAPARLEQFLRVPNIVE